MKRAFLGLVKGLVVGIAVGLLFSLFEMAYWIESTGAYTQSYSPVQGAAPWA